MVSEPRSRADVAASTGKPFAAPPRSSRRTLSISSERLGPVRATVIEPRDGVRASRPLVYVHGGGYVHQFETAHWWLTGALARDLGVRIYAVDYTLAPSGTAATGVAEVTAAVQAVAERHGMAPIVAGDSAGGGLALAVAGRLRDTPAAPAHLLLFAPWLDVAVRNPEARALDRRDPSLALPGLLVGGELWAGDLGPDHPEVSPLFADPTGLPATSLVVGTRDMLYPDARDFAASARAAGVDLATFTASDAFHVFVAATWLPESISARVWVKQRLGPLLHD
ncbi:alpha/beta hydrolase fold domain-containing protein [Gryllotalpicola daejeonensis]|uniref:Alpha/beta hydrolase fold domain-containing protein n=2 Tax=Gryllotalpicola daejeonensis TaxID=993087 RepID=A0ABP7ZL27_9MICO